MRPKAEVQKQGKKDSGTTETWEPTSEQPGFGVFCKLTLFKPPLESFQLEVTKPPSKCGHLLRLSLGTKLSAQYAFRNSHGNFMSCNSFCSSTGSSMPQGHQRFGDHALTTALFSAELPTSDCVNLTFFCLRSDCSV